MRNIVLFSAAAVLMLSGCNRVHQPAGVPVDRTLLELVPSDTDLLVGARLADLRTTAIYQKDFATRAWPQLDTFQQQTGVDPRKDISEVLYCSNGKDPGVLMVNGHFSVKDLESRLQQNGATATPYKNHQLYGNTKGSVTFLNPSTAVAGSNAALRQAVDAYDNKTGGIPAGLKPVVDKVPKGAQFWAVFNGLSVHLPFESGTNLGNVNRLVRSVESGVFSADLHSGFNFHASGTCDNDADAKQVHDALKGIIGFGRLSTPSDKPELLKVYDSIAVDQNGRVVDISANIPQDLAEHFLSMLK